MSDSINQERNAVIVLGMHRSGTSALTRVLNLHGIDLGNDLMPPKENNNPTGFWEHHQIALTHDSLLKELNSSWDDVRPLPHRWWLSETGRRYTRKIIKILDRDFSNSPFWCVKDPRLCRLVPLWRLALEQMNVRAHYILLTRNPLEVAQSLAKRDGFPHGKSFLLWLTHLLEAERDTRGAPRSLVTYEELLSNWPAVMDRARESLGVEFPLDSREADREVRAFLDSDLRHCKFSDSDLTEETRVSQWVRDAHFAISAASGDDEQLKTTLTGIRNGLAAAFDLFTPAPSTLWDTWQRRIGHYPLLVAELTEGLTALQDEVQSLRERRGNDKQKIDQLNGIVTELNERLSRSINERDKQIDQLAARCDQLRNALLVSTSWTRKSLARRTGYLIRMLRRGFRNASFRRGLDYRLIESSGEFDAAHYLAQDSRAAKSGLDPIVHYIKFGAKNGLSPNPEFDGRAYSQRHPELVNAGTNPLVHYLSSPRPVDRSQHAASSNTLLDKVDRYREIKKIRGKAKIVIYTALTGNHDILKQHQHICDDWDYVCITDRPIPGIYAWDFLYADYINVDPVRTARYYKTHPHILFPDYEYSVWVDANLDIVGDHLEQRVDSLMRQDARIASVEHPHWDCAYTDAEKCIKFKKDDPKTIRKTVEYLEARDYPRHKGLFETNLMFRKHNDDVVVRAMNSWWSIITRFSRRDQLSFGCILREHELDCPYIFEEPNRSTRNHPHYRYHQHLNTRGNDLPSYQVPDFNRNLPELQEQIFSYDFRHSFEPDLDHLKLLSIDVIVPVFNALEDVKRCLESLEESKGTEYRLIIADDGSGDETKSWLRSFAAGKPHVTLIESSENHGYTANINKAISISQADFVVLLNSDTVVPPGWVEKMALCAYSSDAIGLVGPLSNAASWQSLPEIEDESGQLIVNDLPPGMTVESVNRFLEERSLHPFYPKVHLLNGFCLGIKREVFDAIGLFDQESFPSGYGEEDDFCLRAGEAGYSLAVATHTYVFHAKSKSFGKARRAEISSRSWEVLRSRYGLHYLQNAVETSKQHPGLVNLRARVRAPEVRSAEPVESPADSKRDWTRIEVPNLYASYDTPQTTESYQTQEPVRSGTDAKLIAFYLPQFYPFEENDRVWGKGFTEWTNVTRALPLFRGHHQPKLPDALGFYDTRLKETLRAQVELARQHGIFGFCFHHYFFGNQPVMRVPLNLFLADRDLDFPFCIHWANEPWTTTWSYTYRDESKDQLIYDQQHTEANDIAFLEDIRPALEDPRYIRVAGRPLLMLYRPGLFPNIKATIKNWRRYCQANGIGDLHMVMVQTNAEGEVDPRKLGFDAAVEFPPHLINPTGVHQQMEFFIPDFDGRVIDYRSIVASFLEKPRPRYTKYRGLIPRWDNTPRKIQGTTIFVNDTPAAFQVWLEGLIRYSREHLPENERFVFVNAWNEWAEGAFLEPDRKYGYAYLNACTRAIQNTSTGEPDFRLETNERIGIQIHAFHMEAFEKIFEAVHEHFGLPADLLISTTDEVREDRIKRITAGYDNGQVITRVFQNRGRDIAPFVVGYADLIPAYTYMLHLHTKKSDYSSELGGWLDYLVQRLTGSRKTVEEILLRLSRPDVGIVFPTHYYAIRDKVRWGANLQATNEILKDAGVRLAEQDDPFFPSGSMFYFKPEALRGLLSKRLRFEDFPIEANQRDGTLAHAIERSFCYFAQSAGYQCVVLGDDVVPDGERTRSLTA